MVHLKGCLGSNLAKIRIFRTDWRFSVFSDIGFSLTEKSDNLGKIAAHEC